MDKYYQYKKPAVEKRTFMISNFGGIDTHNPESRLALGLARYAQNVRMANGRIRQGFGIDVARYDGKMFPFPTDLSVGVVKEPFFYQRYDYAYNKRDDRLLVVHNNNEVYQIKLNERVNYEYTGITLSGLQVGMVNCHYNGQDCVLMYDDNGMMYLYDGSEYKPNAKAPRLGSVCVLGDRFYGTEIKDGNRVFYSAKNEPLVWNDSEKDAGYISFTEDGGSLQKIVAFKGNLYIFRDYTIYKLTIYDDIKDYVLTKIFTGNKKIHAGSIVQTPDKIIFMTDGAFYSYEGGDGFNIMWRDYHAMIESAEQISIAQYNGKYYITARFFTDGSTTNEGGDYTGFNNAVLSIDQGVGEVGILTGVGVNKFVTMFVEDVYYLVGICEKMPFNVCSIDEKRSTIFGHTTYKKWQSPNITLDFMKGNKRLKKFYMRSKYDASATIDLDEQFKFPFPGRFEVQCRPVNGTCETLRITIESTADEMNVDTFGFEIEQSEKKIYGRN